MYTAPPKGIENKINKPKNNMVPVVDIVILRMVFLK